MKERVQEIYESLQERLKSPFLLTFTIIWCIHHWKLFFIILTYDINLNQAHKLELIEGYIEKNGNWWGMIWPSLLWTLGSIIFYYLTTILTKVFAVFYNWALAFTYSKINENRKIVTKEEFNEIERKLKRSQIRAEELQKRVQELNDIVKDEEEKYAKLLEEKNNLIEQNEDLSNALVGQNERMSGQEHTNESIDEVKNIFDKINSNDSLKKAFGNINLYIQAGYTGLLEAVKSEYISFFEANNIIENTGNGVYRLTKQGKILNKLIAESSFN